MDISKHNLNSDALQAVKMDPAVLEVHVTVDTDKEMSSINPQQEQKNELENTEARKELFKFEELLNKQKAALLSLAPRQYELLLKYVEILRVQRQLNQKHLECAFCKNNGESASWYSSHTLKDSQCRVRCPVLRSYRCPGCGATGDFAHTIKYCPINSEDRFSRGC